MAVVFENTWSGGVPKATTATIAIGTLTDGNELYAYIGKDGEALPTAVPIGIRKIEGVYHAGVGGGVAHYAFYGRYYDAYSLSLSKGTISGLYQNLSTADISFSPDGHKLFRLVSVNDSIVVHDCPNAFSWTSFTTAGTLALGSYFTYIDSFQYTDDGLTLVVTGRYSGGTGYKVQSFTMSSAFGYVISSALGSKDISAQGALRINADKDKGYLFVGTDFSSVTFSTAGNVGTMTTTGTVDLSDIGINSGDAAAGIALNDDGTRIVFSTYGTSSYFMGSLFIPDGFSNALDIDSYDISNVVVTSYTPYTDFYDDSQYTAVSGMCWDGDGTTLFWCGSGGLCKAAISQETNFVFEGGSEEWAWVAAEVSGSLYSRAGISSGSATSDFIRIFGNFDSNVNADTVGHTILKFGTVDGDSTPFTLRSQHSLVDQAQSSSGSGSAGVVLAHRTSLIGDIGNGWVDIFVDLDSSDGSLGQAVELAPWVPIVDTSVYGNATLASITPNLSADATVTTAANEFGKATLECTSALQINPVYIEKFGSALLEATSGLGEFTRYDGALVTNWRTETSYCDEDATIKTGDDILPETVVLDGVNTQNRRIRFLVQNGSSNIISGIRPYLQYRYEGESVWNHISKNSYHGDNTAGVKAYPDLGSLSLDLDDYHSLRVGITDDTSSSTKEKTGVNFVEVANKNEPIFLAGTITGSTPDYRTDMCRYNYTLKRFDIVNTVEFNSVTNSIDQYYLRALARKKPDIYAYYTALDEVSGDYGCKKSTDGYTWSSADSDTPPPTGSTGFSMAAEDGTLYRFTDEGSGPYYIYVEEWIGGVWSNKREVDYASTTNLFFVVKYSTPAIYYPFRDIAITEDAVTLYYKDADGYYYTWVIRQNTMTRLRKTKSASRFYTDIRRGILYEYIVNTGNTVSSSQYSVASDTVEYISLEPYEYEGKYFQYEEIESAYGSIYTVPNRINVYFGIGKQIKYGINDDEFHEINTKEIDSFSGTETYSWLSQGFSSFAGTHKGFSAVIEPTTNEVHLCGIVESHFEEKYMLWSHTLPYKFLDRSHTTQQLGVAANYVISNHAFSAWSAPDMNDTNDVIADIPAGSEVEVVTEVVFDPEGFNDEVKFQGTIYFRLMDENENLYLVNGKEARINVINPIERFASASLSCTSILADAITATLQGESSLIANATTEIFGGILKMHSSSSFEAHCLQDTFQVMRYMFQDADGSEAGVDLYANNNTKHNIASTDVFTDYIGAGTEGYASFFRARVQVRNDTLSSKSFNPIIQVRVDEEAWENLSFDYTPNKPALSGYEGRRDTLYVNDTFRFDGGPNNTNVAGYYYDGSDIIHIISHYSEHSTVYYCTYTISTGVFNGNISSYDLGAYAGLNYGFVVDSVGDVFVTATSVTKSRFLHYDISADTWNDVGQEGGGYEDNMTASGFVLDGSSTAWLVTSHCNPFDSTIKLYKWNGSSFNAAKVSTINRAVAWCFHDINNNYFRMMTSYSDSSFREVVYDITGDSWSGPSGTGTGFINSQYTGFVVPVEDLDVSGRFHLMTRHAYSYFLYWVYDPVSGYVSNNVGYYCDQTFSGHYINPTNKAMYAHKYETFYKDNSGNKWYNSFGSRFGTDFNLFNMPKALPIRETDNNITYHGTETEKEQVISRQFVDRLSGISSNFDGADTTQQLGNGTYVSTNKAFFNNHSFLEDPILIPVGSEVELVIGLSLNKSEMDLYTDHPVFQIRLHDASEPVEHREYYPTIRYLAPLNQTVNATLNCTSSLTAIAESGSTGEILGIANLICTSDLSAIVTLGGDVFGYGLLECFGYVDDAIVSMWPGGVIHIQSHSVLTANATENFEAASHLQSASNLNGVPFLEMLNALNINSISNLQAESHNDKNTTSNLVSISAVSAVPTFAHNGKLPIIVSSGSLQANGVRDRHASSRLQTYCNLRAFGLNEVLCLAEMDAEANTSFSSSVDKPGAVSLLSDSTCFALGDITTFGLAGLISVSEVTAIPALDITAPSVLFDCRSDLFGSFGFNDNRDIIEFSSNIERVVEFTLYDNDTDFVQTITTSWELEMYMTQVKPYEMQITQYAQQVLGINQLEEFELQSVELEPILFTGDITMKIEYDLSIVQEATYETEISTDIEYNMQIEKVSDKVIPIGL